MRTAESEFNIQADNWYELRVEVRGKAVRCYADNVLITEATDQVPPLRAKMLCAGAGYVRKAADQLALLTPKLADGSLDYCKTWSSTILGSAKMADGDPLSWGGLWGFDKNVTMDFGKNFKVKSRAFGIQCRDGFPIRVAEAVVYGPTTDSIGPC